MDEQAQITREFWKVRTMWPGPLTVGLGFAERGAASPHHRRHSLLPGLGLHARPPFFRGWVDRRAEAARRAKR